MYARIGKQLYDHAVVILDRIKLFVIAVEKPTAGRLQQIQVVGLKKMKENFQNYINP